MKRISKLLTMAILSGLFLNSCSSDDDAIDNIEEPQAQGAFTNGFFVLNEGGSGAGSVTFIDNEFQNVEQGIYQQVNGGDDLGQFMQSIFFNEELAYIISNGSNLITVVDRYTFELVGKVDSGLQVPRYGVVENGKAYVTNLAAFDSSTDDYVAVIDLETLEVEESIALNAPAEHIIEENGLIYVQNAVFGSGNGISVIDAASYEIVNTIKTKENLNSFQIKNGMLYALSSATLEKIDLVSGEVSEIAIVSDAGSAANLDLEDGMIYYTIGNSVFVMEENAETAPEETLLSYSSDSQWGVMYGFEVKNGRIYIADGGDFASNSFIEVYTANGELLENIEVGVGPNGFYFNE
ncbi:quinoprotein amine dehydrogenase [Salegentibacter sp. JZCK2]|uniref:YncE family protein n=1 Tax=Salegentibacter tibetensis TaxID=2873600 RepID=UPI001CC9EBA2|nr:DUF5074 domain-containing protein [Salegentibacter tibetensis]MBZ9728909.1 quinoprotein amine dehydrogenase [Salegentibacter tibetensis]